MSTPEDFVADYAREAEAYRLATEAFIERDALQCEESVTTESAAHEAAWPVLAETALYGLAGDVVRMIEPHSEADPVAVLLHFLIFFGNSVNRSPHVDVGATRHFANLFGIVVGKSSVARKGTAKDEVQRLFRLRDEAWEHNQIKAGLSTGEGLIHAVRDPEEREVENKRTGDIETKLVDPGIQDKRLLALQTEFASVLKVAARESNTLSEVARDAWDGVEVLHVMTRNSPVKATAAHISIIGHSTQTDILKYLSDTEVGNGFGNRFLWVCAKRSKSLPDGGSLTDVERLPLAERVWKALDTARRIKRVAREAEASALWRQVYPGLCLDRGGLYGALTSRAEAQVLRLSLVYALLDADDLQGRVEITRRHLEAALAFWSYCDQSVLYIFGDVVGDKTADRILVAVRQHRMDGMSRTEVSALFGRNIAATELDRALGLLERLGKIRTRLIDTGSVRRETRYFPC